MNPLFSQAQHLSQNQHQLLQQQQTLHLQNLIQTFSDPSIKNLQSHNKNKIQRQLLDIATNFYSMIDKLEMIKWFCIDYKTTLESYKKEQMQRVKQSKLQQKVDSRQRLEELIEQNNNKMIEESLENSVIPLIFQQQLSLQANSKAQQNPFALPMQQQTYQQQQHPKPLIILPAKRVETNKQQIQSTINKLKVMIVKVNTRQSSSFEHVYSTYVSRLKYNSNLDEKRFKMHKVKCILNYLPKRYTTLKIQSRNIYPYHPTRYPNPQLIGFQYNESAMFFISFYAQQLLFFNHEPIMLKPGFSELLYCPIIFMKGKADESMKISPWYYDQLNLIEPTWRGTILLIKVFNTQTSLKQPIYYSHIIYKKYQLPNELKNSFDEVNKGFHFMQHRYSNEEQLLSDLQTLKFFIFQTLIFGHLKKLFTKNTQDDKNSNKAHEKISIDGGFRVEFQLVSDLEFKESLQSLLNPKTNSNDSKKYLSKIFEISPQLNDSLPVFKSELISDLLLFYKRKNLFTFRRGELAQELQVLFKTTIFKMITEDMQYRTVSPLYSGSLGLYYYEKRSIRKMNVNNFLENFTNN